MSRKKKAPPASKKKSAPKKAPPAPKKKKRPEPQLPTKAAVTEIVEQVMLASPIPKVRESSPEELKQEAAVRLAAHEAEIKRLAAIGLVEIPVRGSPYTLVGLADTKAEVSLEQRVEISKRLNAVGPMLPRYIKHVVAEPPKPKEPINDTGGSADMAKKGKVAVEVERAHAANLKELEKIEKARAEKKARIPDVLPDAGKYLSDAAKKRLAKEEEARKAKQKGGKPAAKGKAAAAATTPPAKAPKKAKNMTPPKVPAGGFTKANVPATSGELIRARIIEHKLNDEAIATEVRKLFPGRNTQVSDVRWNRGQMRKHGVDAPDPIGEGPQQPKGKKK